MPHNADMWALLSSFSWQELRHHPWRNASALLAVMLGVALAYSVHLLNTSALEEFAQAARSVSGRSDVQLRARQGYLDEVWYQRLAQRPGVALVAPVLDVHSYVPTAQGKQSLRVLGVDLLSVWELAPQLAPLARSDGPTQPWSALAPGQVFLNPAAQGLVEKAPMSAQPAPALMVQNGAGLSRLEVAGQVALSGAALAVMDIAAAQELFQRPGQLSYLDIKLRPGVSSQDFMQGLEQDANWSQQLSVSEVQASQTRLSKLSRAYRVNLTVLAMIALFTGAFLVFSVLSLSVAKRAQQFALLGVLGLSGPERLRLVLAESLVLGTVGSAAGLALGAALAWLGLRTLGGDLGGGFFAGAVPRLQVHADAAVLYGTLGVAASLLGAWWPARQAALLAPAQTLKGLSAQSRQHTSIWFSLSCLLAAALLAQAPPLWDMPLAAYGSVALLLIGGIGALPWLIALLLMRCLPAAQHHTLVLLALERARRQRAGAAVAVGSVVASLSLAVALTVMVGSFRTSVMQWLDQVLPADLYVRSARSVSASDTVYFSGEFVRQASLLEGVRELQAQRQFALQLSPDLPALTLMARRLHAPARELPLLTPALAVPDQRIAVYVSEAVVDLYGVEAGSDWPALSQAFAGQAGAQAATPPSFFIAGIWRDYARQSGSVVMDARDYTSLRDDPRVNDLAIWLTQAEAGSQVQTQLRALLNQAQPGAGDGLEFGTAQEIRAASLRIFDRSFAVTYWLQAVAVAIGLFGVAASFSAQVLARRKEFGLLSHLGLTRRQILSLVALEGAAWTSLGAVAGLGLGLLVALVLVKVVNPQSFHWTMDLMVPWARLLVLLLAVVLCATLTAWLAGRAAASRDAVLAVKEDW